MKNLGRKHYIIIGIWFAVNLLQAIFTGLHSDESYYWMYSQNLAWGYFDHPPMVALFIYLGHLILPGEIGVRLLFILFSTVTFALILNELNEKRDLFFVALFMFSFPLMHTHISGFLALPDAPLLFFTMLFIIAYRKFLEQPNWKISILLSVIIAAMIYSKYHAFVVIGLTVLSNLKLFKSKYFYGIIILTALLLVPHLYWQFENDFPTFKYHLIERAKPFRLKYVFPYLFGQLAIAGPLTGVLVFWELSKFKIRDLFQRALIYNILGFYILFFILSFKNRIEAH
ncbi:MAG TPA: glycosyltransferase family 39 protein, partial [Draconibacterium sp.]|nr:glycosyltransferase family 39 protein [Draconibacterium sp.]